jgi:hypothetical protein
MALKSGVKRSRRSETEMMTTKCNSKLVPTLADQAQVVLERSQCRSRLAVKMTANTPNSKRSRHSPTKIKTSRCSSIPARGSSTKMKTLQSESKHTASHQVYSIEEWRCNRSSPGSPTRSSKLALPPMSLRSLLAVQHVKARRVKECIHLIHAVPGLLQDLTPSRYKARTGSNSIQANADVLHRTSLLPCARLSRPCFTSRSDRRSRRSRP